MLAASIGATGTALAQQHLRNVLAYHAFEEVPELAVVHYVGGINIYISSVHIVNERNRQEAVIHLSRILPAIRSGDV